MHGLTARLVPAAPPSVMRACAASASASSTERFASMSVTLHRSMHAQFPPFIVLALQEGPCGHARWVLSAQEAIRNCVQL